MSFSDYLEMLAPWQPSPLLVVIFSVLAIAYFRGNRIQSDGFWHQLSFWLGLSLCYIVLHTKFDYYAQYMFFMHRLQHLVLHHLGSFLICLAAPWGSLMRGLGTKQTGRINTLLHFKGLRWFYLFFQNPIVATLLFVGLIAFWLNPEIHFYAMLNESLYQIMNWSMLIDGLLFWWLILNPMSKDAGARVSYGGRIVMLIVIALLQIVIGAYITFSKSIIYDIYSVCGRAWPMDPMTDQTYGGLITWIPSAMMSLPAVLVVIYYIMHKNTTSAHSAKSTQQ